MVDVFVAFIRVVYGRMIYMSLPVRGCSMRGNRSPPIYGSLRSERDLLISEKTNIHILVNLLAIFTKVMLV